ncbi:hypothetical protein NQZ68_035186 [Dissostichus eleginoides]|nr:hypothetical protein NQZ68_035186 [Dissostichus eleginoides]
MSAEGDVAQKQCSVGLRQRRDSCKRQRGSRDAETLWRNGRQEMTSLREGASPRSNKWIMDESICSVRGERGDCT